MAIIDNLKQLFGLGSPSGTPGSSVPEPAGVPVSQLVAPAPAPVHTLLSSLGMPTTPRQRELLYSFIVEKLSAYSSETDGLPTGLKLWVHCTDTSNEDRMGVALYASQPGHFKQELSRHLSDQYIKLAPAWQFSYEFVRNELPADCTYRQGELGLEVIRPATEKPLKARLRVLTGQTAEPTYLLDPSQQSEFRLGRGQLVQTASGRVRTNDIAFLDEGEPGFDEKMGDPNLSVSRQHATIRYDATRRHYCLLADAGGVPTNGNKTKILRADDTIERADLPGVGYVLKHGDQIELGGEAKLMIELL